MGGNVPPNGIIVGPNVGILLSNVIVGAIDASTVSAFEREADGASGSVVGPNVGIWLSNVVVWAIDALTVSVFEGEANGASGLVVGP